MTVHFEQHGEGIDCVGLIVHEEDMLYVRHVMESAVSC
jgi:hypothetical protein